MQQTPHDHSHHTGHRTVTTSPTEPSTVDRDRHAGRGEPADHPEPTAHIGHVAHAEHATDGDRAAVGAHPEHRNHGLSAHPTGHASHQSHAGDDAPAGYGTDHAGHGRHAEHGGHGADHAGHADIFRRRFWVTLLLSIPVVLYSEMVQEWLGFSLPSFPGSSLIPPALGTVVFLYGGAVFLAGGWDELKARRLGMMLLISLAITVAFAASAASTLGLIDLEFWWELALLVVIMLLGHWQEMRAVGQAQGALSALAALLPDEAERVTAHGVDLVPLSALHAGDVVRVRPRAPVPAHRVIVDGHAESMITGESRPVTKSVGDRVVAGTVAAGSSSGSRSRPSVRRPRSPESSGSWSRRSGRAPVPRRSPIASPRPCSTSRWRPGPAPSSSGRCWDSRMMR